VADPHAVALPAQRAAAWAARSLILPVVELEDRPGRALVEALVEQARTRDPDAWEALYRLAYPGLFSYAARRVGSHLADDVVSETMARAVAGIHRYETGRGFTAWLFGIGRHVISDFSRRRQRWARQPHEAPLPTEPAPGEAIELDVEHRRMSAAFAQLSAGDQEVLELRVLSGLTSEEVGQILGKKAEAVRTAQSRALARLRTMVAERDD
jgi:RNA polymerase sigma-70 factor (ECF subfamily)